MESCKVSYVIDAIKDQPFKETPSGWKKTKILKTGRKTTFIEAINSELKTNRTCK